MTAFDDLPVVREAVWLYAGGVEVRVRILASPETLGSGDYEDGDLANDKPIPCFLVAYEAAGSPGEFKNVTVNLPTLDAAYKLVEERFPGVRWKA